MSKAYAKAVYSWARLGLAFKEEAILKAEAGSVKANR